MNYHMRKSFFYSLTAFVALLSATQAQAQSHFYPNDATVNDTVEGFIFTGYANQQDYFSRPRRNPTSPTINIVTGGSITGGLFANNRSTINFHDGVIGSDIYLSDQSSLNMTGGYVSNGLTVFSSGMVNISGGTVYNYLQTSFFSHANLTGGYFDKVNGSGTINISGNARVGDLYSVRDSRGNALQDGHVNISGGEVHWQINAMGSTIDITGGRISASLFVQANGSLNLYGMGLTANLEDADYIYERQSYSKYYIFGTLRDNTPLYSQQLFVQNGTGARFTLNNVPEPGTTALLISSVAVSTGIFLKRRRNLS